MIWRLFETVKNKILNSKNTMSLESSHAVPSDSFVQSCGEGASGTVQEDDRYFENEESDEILVKKLACNYCHRKYRYKQSLSRHRRTAHRLEIHREKEEIGQGKQNSTIVCLEENCSFRAMSVAQLRHHLTEVHGKQFNIVQKQFNSWEEFAEWKNSVENWLQVSFVAKGGQRLRSSVDLKYFYCNRTGIYDGRHDSGKRRKSDKGSSKLGFYCTATMTAKLHKDTGQVLVETCVDHYGHSVQLAHLRIPKLERQRLMKRLKDGVPIQQLIQESQSTWPELPADVAVLLDSLPSTSADAPDAAAAADAPRSSLARLFLIDDKYLRNLSKSCGIRGERGEEMELDDDSYESVLYLKRQGVVDVEEEFLSMEDYVLILQTRHQRDMLEKLGQKGICVDWSSGPEKKQETIYLFTMVVVDEFGSGIPVCHMITSRLDYQHLMELVYRKLGAQQEQPLNPTWILLDEKQSSHHLLRKELKLKQLMLKMDGRLDLLVSALLLRDRKLLFSRLRRLALGGADSSRMARIHKGHADAEVLTFDRVVVRDSGEFLVKSSSSDEFFSVQPTPEEDGSCPGPDCQLRCRQCAFCVHKFSCTCPASSNQREDTCEHVHLIGRFLRVLGESADDETDRFEWGQEQATQLFRQTVSQHIFAGGLCFERDKRKALDLCSRIRNLVMEVESDNRNLSEIIQHLTCAVTKLEVTRTGQTAGDGLQGDNVNTELGENGDHVGGNAQAEEFLDEGGKTTFALSSDHDYIASASWSQALSPLQQTVLENVVRPKDLQDFIEKLSSGQLVEQLTADTLVHREQILDGLLHISDPSLDLSCVRNFFTADAFQSLESALRPWGSGGRKDEVVVSIV